MLRHFFIWTAAAWLALVSPVVLITLDLRIAGGAYTTLDGWVLPLAIAAAVMLALKSFAALLQPVRALSSRSH